MDNLTMACKENPVYIKNLYKWIPEPQTDVLKWSDRFIPVMEATECPYCGPLPQKDIIQCGNGIVCIQNNKLMVITSDGYMSPTINYCPMCGRSF